MNKALGIESFSYPEIAYPVARGQSPSEEGANEINQVGPGFILVCRRGKYKLSVADKGQSVDHEVTIFKPATPDKAACIIGPKNKTEAQKAAARMVGLGVTTDSFLQLRQGLVGWLPVERPKQ